MRRGWVESPGWVSLKFQAVWWRGVETEMEADVDVEVQEAWLDEGLDVGKGLGESPQSTFRGASAPTLFLCAGNGAT